MRKLTTLYQSVIPKPVPGVGTIITTGFSLNQKQRRSFASLVTEQKPEQKMQGGRTMAKTIVFDIEVAFYPEITEMAMKRGVDEKQFSNGKFGTIIDANMRYVCHISYKINNSKVVDLSLLDGSGSLRGDTNEKQLLQKFIKAYNSCDEAVAHYGAKFDIKFLNARISMYGLPPLKPIKMIDTHKILKDKFLLITNKLDSAIRFFGCPYGKPSLDWSVWRKVSLGVEKYHKILRHRCRYDVLSLAWIYYNKLRVYATGTINKSLAHDKMFIDDSKISSQLLSAVCPACGKKGHLKREGYRYTATSTLLQLSCKACCRWSSATLNAAGSIRRIK